MKFVDRLAAAKGSASECWVWPGVPNWRGYHRVCMMADGKARSFYAHRLSYEALVGKIPEGLYIDHLCRNRRCVNPGHMEPVTTTENVLRGTGLTAENARKTHCAQGHCLSGENLVWEKRPGTERLRRVCKACRRAKDRKRRDRAT